MKIDKLKINGFGRVEEKEISLNKHINLIYGKNESGKSTLLNFIKSMFYGANKLKAGKDISDYDKFIPWSDKDYSGKIKYTLDNGNKYEIFRDFKKKSPVIYDENGKDISSEFSVDKSKGIDFIYEQIGLDEETFKNTVITPQAEVRISKQGQSSLIQKISNIIGTGDENLSYKKVMDKIFKRSLEEVGTERSTGRPINIVEKKLEDLNDKKQNLVSARENLKNSKDEKSNSLVELTSEENKLSLLREVRENLEKSNKKEAEIDVFRKIIEEKEADLDELKYKIDRRAKRRVESETKPFWIGYFLAAILVIISIICLIVKWNKIIAISSVCVGALVFILTMILNIKFNYQKQSKIREIENEELKVDQQTNIIKDDIKTQEMKIEAKESEIKEEEERVNNTIKSKYENTINCDFIAMAFDMNLEEVDASINSKINTINKIKIDIASIEREEIVFQEDMDNLISVEEQIENALQEKDELISLNNSFDIAKESLEEAYKEVKNNVSPEFTIKLCEIISKISDGKYKNINFSDDRGLTVELENGEYISAEMLSQGTIDQMYLALRLSSIETICNEPVPVVLDETFSFFDDDRLANILNFLNKNFKNYQIIILSCSKREQEILDRLNIAYNYVSLDIA